ncbi:MAG: phosphate ABC transporter permease PstA [Mycobacteriaceae bacterium]
MRDTTSLERPLVQPAFTPISGIRKVKNSLAGVLVTGAFAFAVLPLLWVLYTVVQRGYKAVIVSQWWTNSQRGILPDDFGGGMYHALYGTLVQGLIASVVSVPLGILVAIYLVEYGHGPLARTTTFMVDVLSGIPSIVAALFVFSVWITTFGFEQSAFAVSLALILLMLPVVIRSSEEMLRLVPDDLREASYALGVSRMTTILRVVLPCAVSGIISGILLAVARVMGETAPVLVLVGYTTSINRDVFHNNMASLPLVIYNELTNPTVAGQQRVWGAALTLILVIAFLNLLAAVVARVAAPKT